MEAYIESGSRDLFGTSRSVVVAKFSAIALSAIGIALSIYGIVYEVVHAGAVQVLPNYTESIQKLVTHGAILLIFLVMAMALRSKNVGK